MARLILQNYLRANKENIREENTHTFEDSILLLNASYMGSSYERCSMLQSSFFSRVTTVHIKSMDCAINNFSQLCERDKYIDSVSVEL